MNIAIVGCGYVADFYIKTLPFYQNLKLMGVYDRNRERLTAFTDHYQVRGYSSLEAVLSDTSVEMVLNLTNPRSHYEVTKAFLNAGKHVYSEKPLAMDTVQARELADLAKSKNASLSSAPCNVLGETAQTAWRALKEGVIGRVRLVYANFDDGMIAPNRRPWQWRSPSGAAWPAWDEFEVGCTFEHAGYFLTWLAAFFGPARRVTAFSSCQIPDKGVDVDEMAPDFTVGCIEYDHGIVARVTCGIVAPRDKSLSIIGDHGIIAVDHLRDDYCPVYIRPSWIDPGRKRKLEMKLLNWIKRLERRFNWMPSIRVRPGRRYPFARKPLRRNSGKGKPVDFCRGPAELANSIEAQRPCRLSADLGVHVTELIEALQYPDKSGSRRNIESSFDPIQPLPWD